jgi:hypothetical protein
MRVKKGITGSLSAFEQSKGKLNDMRGKNKEEVLKTINMLEREIKRLDKYVTLLSETKLP